MKTVKITANPENGQVFTPNEGLGKDGKQYGYFRVESNSLDLSNGFARVASRSALVAISADDFKKASAQLTAGTELTGTIIAIDSLEEQAGFQPLMAPVSKDSDELRPVTSNGQQVYRKNLFTTNVESIDAKMASYDVVKVESTTLAGK